MRLLFVRSHKIGSKFLQWALEQPVSHVVIEFDSSTHEFFHSYGRGLQRLSVDGFKEHGYEVVHRLDLPLSPQAEQAAHERFKKSIGYQLYDYPALVYFGLRVIMKKLFGSPYPALNKWSILDSNLCTEVIYLATEVYSDFSGRAVIPGSVDLAMITPQDAYFEISKFIRESV